MHAARSDTTTLQVNGLTVRYGHTTAVDAVSMSAERGEILGLLGPNGAGKTSVIRALTTIVPAAEGSAMIAGHPLTDPTAVRASIGVLPESNGYPFAQTGRSYLRFYGQLFGLSGSDASERAERVLNQMGLGSNHNRIASYSRGMRQRLGLARALLNSPDIVFLDEPTLGLDPAGQEDILGQLTQIASEDGTCVVLCSHLLDEVERVCDRVAILHESRIVAHGTVDQVIARAEIGHHGRVRVAPDHVTAAMTILDAIPAMLSTSSDSSRSGGIRIELATSPGTAGMVLRALLDAGIEPLSFDLHGARLSDAFLALTTQKNAITR